jgi:hypothetical protein
LRAATGSAVENALILSVTEVSPRASIGPRQGYRQGLDEL